MKKPKTYEIDLIEIARARAIGPISAGADLAEIGSLLWLPDYWQFDANGQFFVSWMNFGDVEVGFVAANDLVCVEYAKFYMAGFKNGMLKFAKVNKAKRIHIRNNFRQKGPFFTLVANEMRNQNVDFSTEVKNYVSEETWGIMHFGDHLSFYFSCSEDQFSLEKSRLNFVSISISRDEIIKMRHIA